MARLLLIVAFAVVLTSSVSGHEVGGLTFEVPDNDEFCLYEKFRNASVYIIDFKVLKGGNLDIDVEIRSPKGKILYRDFRRKHDTLPLEVSVGIFTFCFSNAFSSLTHKVVHFNLRPSEMDTRALAREVDSAAVRPGVNTMVDQMMETIHAFTTKVMQYQTVYRLNEAQGRYIAETLNWRVTWWSTVQALIIMATGLGQLFVLKRFFTDRRDASAPAGRHSNDCSHTGKIHARP